MNLRSEKNTPDPFGLDIEAAQPLATKVSLDPVLSDLIGIIKEKKNEKCKKMRMSD